MSLRLFNDILLTNIANAIRFKSGSTELIRVDGLAQAITDLPSGGSNKLPLVIDKTVVTITAADLLGITTIGAYAFSYCSNLTSITIPNSVTRITDWAFWVCSSLTSVIIPNSITNIGNGVFYGCSDLTNVTIGNSVTSIGDRVFYNCNKLTTITCNATTPPTINSTTLPGTSIVQHIYVPSASVDTYKSATNWVTYADVIEAIS